MREPYDPDAPVPPRTWLDDPGVVQRSTRPVTRGALKGRWYAYVMRRLDEIGRGEGDFTGLKVPAPAVVERARQEALTWPPDRPTPSVVPTEDGGVLFAWHKDGHSTLIEVDETGEVERIEWTD